MSSTKTSINIVAVGFMLFALFFGAGNLIFPPMLGQLSGENVFSANLGFIVTGVGLPILAVLALAYSGKNDLQSLASRVHPFYGIFFTVALYLTIGPFFAIPRTNTVAFEIGVVPFIGEANATLSLLLFTIVFFGVTLFFSLQAQRIVDIVGKMLTPVLLIAMLILIVAFFLNPIGEAQPPTEDYAQYSFFVGFQEGYLTMDALAAFVFGIIVINIIKDAGAKTKREIMSLGWKIAVIAGILLAFIYSSLAYLGAGGVEELGYLDNGGAILSAASNFYFGHFGSIILGIIVVFACLTTSIGLITSCASYFTKLIPSLSYNKWAVVFTLVSAVIANFGLNAIIEFSVPVLSALYPLAMALLVLTFLHPLYQGRKEVYQFSILLTLIVSVLDGLNAAGINIEALNNLFTTILPWYTIGLGWIVPMLVGGVIGFIISIFKTPRHQPMV
ncbi:branched-chain amino acid transport system II carrier protein [Aliibacillus thermotolerans]|uniref:Branched-chain amino acid transport system carrier protein n=1 Tax=Aliibacillus thermotolerans TaxID=1834418 RepID=A0ABW0U8C5_9BACI|nr:branched-chain amino acid transport system II carrier protein [Aliibacillus thermotolerans]MDA3130279.1 branched-chain amino acid transport system II carrier protein [Aliibacillus thermotolerans]